MCHCVTMSLCAGAVYIFAPSDGGASAWTQAQKVVGADSSPIDNFGWAVSLYGGQLAVGAWKDDDKGGDSGGLYRCLL
jgi:hypothetical protein